MGSTPSVVEQTPKFPLDPQTVELWVASQKGLRMAEAIDICSNYNRGTLTSQLLCYIFDRMSDHLDAHNIRKAANQIREEVQQGLHAPDWTPEMLDPHI